MSRIYTSLYGGNATEDVNSVGDNTLKRLKGIAIPSADTILRGDVELSIPCDYTKTASGKKNKINANTRMNKFLLESALKFNQLNPKDKDLTYGFGYRFIAADKI